MTYVWLWMSSLQIRSSHFIANFVHFLFQDGVFLWPPLNQLGRVQSNWLTIFERCNPSSTISPQFIVRDEVDLGEYTKLSPKGRELSTFRSNSVGFPSRHFQEIWYGLPPNCQNTSYLLIMPNKPLNGPHFVPRSGIVVHRNVGIMSSL